VNYLNKHRTGLHVLFLLISPLTDYYTYLAQNQLIFTTMQKEGTVKFFNETKGFGFIIPSSGESEIFVHTSGLIDQIRENDHVQYEEEQGRKGLNAVNVKVIA
jgi:CspA family cold shock protein